MAFKEDSDGDPDPGDLWDAWGGLSENLQVLRSYLKLILPWWGNADGTRILHGF